MSQLRQEITQIRRSVETGFDYNRLSELMTGCSRTGTLLLTSQLIAWYVITNPDLKTISVFDLEFNRPHIVFVLLIIAFIGWSSLTHHFSSILTVFERMQAEHRDDARMLLRLHGWYVNPFSISAIPIMLFSFLQGSTVTTISYLVFMNDTGLGETPVAVLIVASAMFIIAFISSTNRFLGLRSVVFFDDFSPSLSRRLLFPGSKIVNLIFYFWLLVPAFLLYWLHEGGLIKPS